MTNTPEGRDKGSMRPEEYAILDRLVRHCRPTETLEIGMANGGSTVVICRALRETGGVRHTAVDPFQRHPEYWASRGLKRVQAASLDSIFELIEDFDFIALPRLLEQGRVFDFVLIDGWHSFDHTMIDLFYADRLLRDGGVLAVHDTGWPAVHKACRFLETHKPYERLSPPIGLVIPSIAGRAVRRARQVLAGSEARADARRRRAEWFSLAAYCKLRSHQVADDFFEPF